MKCVSLGRKPSLGLIHNHEPILYFVQIDVHNLKESQIIRRYVELPKLFDLLLNQQMFFPTLQTLGTLDPFECGMLPRQKWQRLKRHELENEAMSLLQFVPSRCQTGDRAEDFERYQQLVKKCPITGLRQHVAELQAALFKDRVVCNCWHADDAESDAMWKIYSKGPGVMLESTVGQLMASIMGQYSRIFCSPNPQHYEIAPIRYEDASSLTGLPEFYVDHPWLLKRRSFAHEKEIRISHLLPCVIGPQDGGMLIRMAPSKLITEIVLSPFTEQWANGPTRSAIGIVLQKAGLDIPIRVSDHASAPTQISPILGSLDFQKLRDMMNGGWRSSKQWEVARGLLSANVGKQKAIKKSKAAKHIK